MYQKPHLITPGDQSYQSIDQKLAQHGKGRFRTYVSNEIKKTLAKLMQEARANLNGIHGTTIYCCVDDSLLKNYFYRIKDPVIPEGLNIIKNYKDARDWVIATAKSVKKQDAGFVVYPDGRMDGGYIFTANFNDLDNAFGIDFKDVEETIFKNRNEGGTRTVNAIAAAYVMVGGYIGLLRTHNGLYIFQNKEGIITLPYLEGNSGVDPEIRIDTNRRGDKKSLQPLESIAATTQ